MDRGKTVLVTGGAGGLGRAVAEAFVESGANVVMCDINRKLLDGFHEKVVSANPDQVLAIESDITSEAALDSAGLCDKFDPAGDLERAEYDKIIAINLTAPTFITKRAVNGFLENEKKGSIVNIASVASFRGFANGAAYTASKHGLIGRTRNTAAFDRLKGIRCNAIQAGAMPASIGAHLANGLNQEGMGIMKKTFGDWEGALTETKKMAKLVRFLCSDDSEMLNGTVVTADGGITAI